jgi:hypothetical protein
VGPTASEYQPKLLFIASTELHSRTKSKPSQEPLKFQIDTRQTEAENPGSINVHPPVRTGKILDGSIRIITEVETKNRREERTCG